MSINTLSPLHADRDTSLCCNSLVEVYTYGLNVCVTEVSVDKCHVHLSQSDLVDDDDTARCDPAFLYGGQSVVSVDDQQVRLDEFVAVKEQTVDDLQLLLERVSAAVLTNDVAYIVELGDSVNQLHSEQTERGQADGVLQQITTRYLHLQSNYYVLMCNSVFVFRPHNQ